MSKRENMLNVSISASAAKQLLSGNIPARSFFRQKIYCIILFISNIRSFLEYKSYFYPLSLVVLQYDFLQNFVKVFLYITGICG